jgi:DNA mismatch repair protein MutS2
VNFYPEDILKVLEFDRIRERVEQHCRCEASRSKAVAIRPIHDLPALEEELVRVEEFRVTLENKGYFPDFLFEDFTNEARLLGKSGAVLTESQLGKIRAGAVIVNDLLDYLRSRVSVFAALNRLCAGLPVNKEIPGLIDAVLDHQSQVKSSASAELGRIRHELSSKRREADKRFRSYINDLKKRGWLRENEENFYNNRRVLAVPTEFKKDLKGIVHGKSESGKTTFIEPDGLIELNNEVAELEQDERNEVLRLLRELTFRLKPFATTVSSQLDFLVALDLIRAKALFSRDIGARLPVLQRQPELRLVKAYHPLLLLQNRGSGKETIPLDLELDKENRIIIISGPNAGGKSITLKTVGLLQVMLQSGLPVPVGDGSSMGFFRHLFADIGDSQSIENALSTYSSRLLRMNHFLRMAGGGSLVLIDEFGTGTDPELGGAIAEVVLEELNRKNCFGVFTTHYTNIKLLADHLKGVRNASMLFEPETLQPLYRLVSGQPGSSYTFEVAERIGLPQHLLDRARKKVQKDNLRLNRLLADLHRQKHRVEEELKQLQEQQLRTTSAEERFGRLNEKLTARLEKERERQEEMRRLSELGRKLSALSDEWLKSKDKKPIIKKFAGLMTALAKKHAAENTPEKSAAKKHALLEKLRSEITVGSKVRMLKSRQVGTVDSIRKDNVHVDFGNMTATVAITTLELYVEEKEKKKKAT